IEPNLVMNTSKVQLFLVRGFCGMLLALQMLIACTGYHPKNDAKVLVKKVDDRYELYRDGKPFVVKGGAGNVHLGVLQQIGGNTIRVWDTVGLGTILKEADELGIAVIVGLPIPESQYMNYYNDASW